MWVTLGTRVNSALLAPTPPLADPFPLHPVFRSPSSRTRVWSPVPDRGANSLERPMRIAKLIRNASSLNSRLYSWVPASSGAPDSAGGPGQTQAQLPCHCRPDGSAPQRCDCCRAPFPTGTRSWRRETHSYHDHCHRPSQPSGFRESLAARESGSTENSACASGVESRFTHFCKSLSILRSLSHCRAIIVFASQMRPSWTMDQDSAKGSSTRRMSSLPMPPPPDTRCDDSSGA
jgi:hypothetical protein